MRNILIDLNDINNDMYYTETIREGENKASQLVITLNGEFTGYSYRLNFQLNSLTPYNTVALTPVNGVITYELTNVVTFVDGTLKCELQAYDVNDSLVKSAVFELKVTPAISGTPVTIPVEYQTYVELGTPSIPDVDSTLVKRGTDGNFGISIIDFSDVASVAETTRGRLQWDNVYKCLVYGLQGGIGSHQIGQEFNAFARNNSGVDMSLGQVVTINGTTGEMITIGLAKSNGTEAEARVLGLSGGVSGIPKNTEGYVLCKGILNAINTNSWNQGDSLWLDTTYGAITNVKPTLPTRQIFIGTVIKKAGAGKIYVDVHYVNL
jgi:hypothetical protein